MEIRHNDFCTCCKCPYCTGYREYLVRTSKIRNDWDLLKDSSFWFWFIFPRTQREFSFFMKGAVYSGTLVWMLWMFSLWQMKGR